MAKPEDTVPKENTSPYLIATVIEPLRNGKSVTYGTIDFSRFELDDLRRAAGYCEDICRTSNRLESFVEKMCAAEAASCKKRSFC